MSAAQVPGPGSRARFLGASSLHWRDPNTQFLVLVVLVGLLGAGGAILFRLLTHALTRLVTGQVDITEAARTLEPVWRIALPAAGGLLGGFVARRFVRTGGTMGIAQIMEVLSVGRRTVRLRQSTARAASSLIVISTGGSEGREGPIIQMAAALASSLGRKVRVSPERAQLLVACGLAAGVAGAYNTPISGTLFVIELIIGSFSMSVFGPVVVASVVSAIATHVALGDAPLYRVQPFESSSAVQEFLVYAPIGLLSGVGSVFFMRSLRLCKRLFAATGWHDEWRMLVGGAAVGAIALLLPDVWGNGFEGTNRVLAGTMTAGALGLLCLGKVVGTGLTIGSGGVGGVFTPALMVGATLGAAVGTLAQAVAPQLTPPVYCCALVGMGGLLAGTTRAPFLAIIMMFELTRAPALVLPMMIGSLASILGARLFERESIYVEELRAAGVHWQGTLQGTAFSSMRVRELLRTDVALFPPTLALADMVDLFVSSRATHLYVGTEGRLLGVVDLHDIKEVTKGDAVATGVIAHDLMREVPFASIDDSVASVNAMLWLRDHAEIPVVDDPTRRKFLGVVTQRDILGALDREVLGRSALSTQVTHISGSAREVGQFEVPEGHRVAMVDVPQDCVGQTLASTELRSRHGVLVLAVHRLTPDGVVRRFVPSATEVLARGDRLVVLATLDGLALLGVRGDLSG